MSASSSASRIRRFVDREAGVTLIETAVACGLMVVVLAGVAAMTTLAMKLTENEGHLTTRTAEYAVDKMEQLQELTYGDAQSNTTVFPSVTSGGTGLADGGSADPAAGVASTSMALPFAVLAVVGLVPAVALLRHLSDDPR